MKRSKIKGSGCKYEVRTKEEKYIICDRDGSQRKRTKGCRGKNCPFYKKIMVAEAERVAAKMPLKIHGKDYNRGELQF